MNEKLNRPANKKKATTTTKAKEEVKEEAKERNSEQSSSTVVGDRISIPMSLPRQPTLVDVESDRNQKKRDSKYEEKQAASLTPANRIQINISSP